jgi:hypothetical protein
MEAAVSNYQPDLISVVGMPDEYLRKVYEASKKAHIEIVCDSMQYTRIREWMTKDGSIKTA